MTHTGRKSLTRSLGQDRTTPVAINKSQNTRCGKQDNIWQCSWFLVRGKKNGTRTRAVRRRKRLGDNSKSQFPLCWFRVLVSVSTRRRRSVSMYAVPYGEAAIAKVSRHGWAGERETDRQTEGERERGEIERREPKSTSTSSSITPRPRPRTKLGRKPFNVTNRFV